MSRSINMPGCCRILLLSLVMILPFDALRAVEIPMSDFRAVYSLSKGETEVGDTILEVKNSGDRIRWQMTAIPTGIYALVIGKNPYSESIQIRHGGEYRLSSVRVSAGKNDPPQEIGEFDWHQSRLSISRKGKQKELSLSGNVYDYLSIHWLVAQMRLTGSSQYDLSFYRNGKLLKSALTNTGNDSIKIGDKTIKATVFEQTFEGSSRRLTYHYSPKNSWLPLRIERNKKGKKPTILLLKSVETSP